jgi:hypothetical protein
MKPKFLVTVFFILTFTFWPLTVAHADPSDLKVEVYTYDPQALPEMQPYELCDSAWVSVANIDVDWGGDVVADCQADFVLIHYSGYLTSPVTADVMFQSWADDGFYMSFDGVPVIENWWPKGCSGGSAVVPMLANVSVKFDAWWYEYGGGACNRLYWYAQDGVSVVPESAFSQDVAVPVEPVKPEPPIVIVPIPEPTLPVVIPDPVIPDPVIPEPVIPEPVIPEPVIPEPVIPEPVVIPEPPVIDPVTPVEPVLPPEPISTPEPVVEPVVEPLQPDLPIVEPVVPTPEEAHQILLDTLLEEAQADDLKIPVEIANIPVLGATIVALTDALNFVGNVGADMSPKVRAQAKKEVVAAIVLTQISQFATSQSLASAQSSASAGASGSGSKTRRNKE